MIYFSQSQLLLLKTNEDRTTSRKTQLCFIGKCVSSAGHMSYEIRCIFTGRYILCLLVLRFFSLLLDAGPWGLGNMLHHLYTIL